MPKSVTTEPPPGDEKQWHVTFECAWLFHLATNDRLTIWSRSFYLFYFSRSLPLEMKLLSELSFPFFPRHIYVLLVLLFCFSLTIVALGWWLHVLLRYISENIFEEISWNFKLNSCRRCSREFWNNFNLPCVRFTFIVQIFRMGFRLPPHHHHLVDK